MVQIIQEREKERRPSFMDRLGNAAGTAAELIPQYLMQQEQQKVQAQKMQQENEVLSKLTGLSFDQLQNPTIRQKAFEFAMQSQQKEKEFGMNAEQAQRKYQEEQRAASQKSLDDFNRQQELLHQKGQQQKELEGIRQQGKKQEKPKDVEPLKNALKTINTMREIRKKGNLGVGTDYSWFPSTQEDASKYSRLGRSLIQFSTNIQIRNRQEFEAMAHDLYDPSITDAKAKGILDAMEQIIIQGIEEVEGPMKQDFILRNVPEKNATQTKRRSFEEIFK